MPSIKINQIDLYYEILGEGFPLVFINDLAENIDTWQVISSNISQHFKLILLGEEDILFHPQEADILYQGIIHASYPLFVQNCGHAVHIEHPKQFINAILGFLYKYIR